MADVPENEEISNNPEQVLEQLGRLRGFVKNFNTANASLQSNPKMHIEQKILCYADMIKARNGIGDLKTEIESSISNGEEAKDCLCTGIVEICHTYIADTIRNYRKSIENEIIL